MKCERCNAQLTPPFRFCGVCGHQQSAVEAPPTHYHYSGGGLQKQLPVGDIIERILAAPQDDHHLWNDGWDGWKPWREVDAIATPAEDALAIQNEDPAKVAEYKQLVAEMAADGVIEQWELEVLTERRQALGISKATHDKLVAEYENLGAKLLSAQLDESAMAAFRAGQSCVLRLRVRNEGTRGLSSVRVQAATSSTEGLVEVSVNRVAPGGDDTLLVRLNPEVAGQHELSVLFTTTGYDRTASWYRSRAVVFQVARASGDGGTKVYNVDLSAMQVGKVGNLGATEAGGGGLLRDARWVPMQLTPMTEVSAREWIERRGSSLPGVPAPPKPPRSEPYSKAPPAPVKAAPPTTWHYSGPSGQETLTGDLIAAKVRDARGEDHHVWQEGWPGWKAWSEVPELVALVGGAGGAGSLGDQPWVSWPESVRAWMCTRVAADTLALRMGAFPTRSHLAAVDEPIRLLDAVDAHALVRSGLTHGLAWKDGTLYATVDPGALLAAGRTDLLARVAPDFPGAFGAVLRGLTTGADVSTAWQASRQYSRGFRSASGLVAAALQAELGAEAKAVARAPFDAPGHEPDRSHLEQVRACVRLLDNGVQARRHMAVVESWQSATPKRAQAIWLAWAEASLFADTAAVAALGPAMGSASMDQHIELAELQRLVLDDERSALRSLVRAQSAQTYNDVEDLCAQARAWLTLLDDAGEARSSLEAAETEAKTRGHIPMVAAAWQALFGDSARAQRLLLRHPDHEGSALAWALLPGEQDQAAAAPPEGDPATHHRQLARRFAAIGQPDQARKALEKATAVADFSDNELAWSWRWLADDAAAARRLLSTLSGQATRSPELLRLAEVAQVVECSDLTVRLLVKAEAAAASAADFLEIAKAWAGPVHNDRSEHDRTLQAAHDWGTQQAADDPAHFKILRDYLLDEGTLPALVARLETRIAQIESQREAAAAAAAAAKRKAAAAAQREREASERQAREKRERQARERRERQQREREERQRQERNRTQQAERKRAAQTKRDKEAYEQRRSSYLALRKTVLSASELQQGTECATISGDCLQALWVSSKFPREVIKWAWDQDWYVLSLHHHPKLKKYICVVTQRKDYLGQGWKRGTEKDVRAYIDRKKGEGFIITCLFIMASTWTVVMTKVRGASRPLFNISDKYPREWLNQRIQAKENVFGMSVTSTKWVVWSAKLPSRRVEGVWTRNGWTSSRDLIREKWKESYQITGITHKAGSNMIALTKGVHPGSQRYTPCKTAAKLSDRARTDWNEQRKILFIGHDDDSWWITTVKELPWIKPIGDFVRL